MATDPINDWAPSLDHIEPQSHTLIPDHRARGDETYYTIADLRTTA